MDKTYISDNIGYLCDKITDMVYLHQEITENFFESYDGDDEKDIYDIAYEFSRYASFNRILNHCLIDVSELSKEIAEVVKDND